MNQIQPSSAEFMKEEEIEVSRTQNEYDRSIMAYNASQLNTMSAATPVSHQDIPLQHFSLTNVHPRQIGLNLPVPRSIPPQRPNPGCNQSLASNGGVRAQEMGLKYLWNEACLEAEGGYDPRETANGLNGLPRSKSVRHGIDQRFLRNEASYNTRSGNFALPMLRYNSVACINNIPLLPSTHPYSNIREFSSRENIDQRLLRNEVSCNTGSDDVVLPMVRHNTMACINDISLLPSMQCNASVRGFNSRENIDQKFKRNKASSNTRSADIALQMLKLNTVASIGDIPLLASTQSNASVEGFNPKRKRKSHEASHKEIDYEDSTQETGGSDGMDIALKLTESEIDMWEGGQTGNKWQVFFILTLIAFVASLAGAAIYSLIGCHMVRCKEGI